MCTYKYNKLTQVLKLPYSCDHNSMTGFHILIRLTQTAEQKINNMESVKATFSISDMCADRKEYKNTRIKPQVVYVEGWGRPGCWWKWVGNPTSSKGLWMLQKWVPDWLIKLGAGDDLCFEAFSCGKYFNHWLLQKLIWVKWPSA